MIRQKVQTDLHTGVWKEGKEGREGGRGDAGGKDFHRLWWYC